MPCIAVARLGDIPAGLSLWGLQGRDVLVAQTDEGIFALEDSCPHQGASLSGGRIIGTQLRCRAHGLKFDMRTGRGPGGAMCVETFNTKVEGGWLFVVLPCLSWRDRPDNS